MKIRLSINKGIDTPGRIATHTTEQTPMQRHEAGGQVTRQIIASTTSPTNSPMNGIQSAATCKGPKRQTHERHSMKKPTTRIFQVRAWLSSSSCSNKSSLLILPE